MTDPLIRTQVASTNGLNQTGANNKKNNSESSMKTLGIAFLALIGAVGVAIACLPKDMSGMLADYNNYFVIAAIPILSILIHKGMKKFGLDQQKWVAYVVLGLAIGVLAYMVFGASQLLLNDNSNYAAHFPYAALFLAPMFAFISLMKNERRSNFESIITKPKATAEVDAKKATTASTASTTSATSESTTIDPTKIADFFNFTTAEQGIHGGVVEQYEISTATSASTTASSSPTPVSSVASTSSTSSTKSPEKIILRREINRKSFIEEEIRKQYVASDNAKMKIIQNVFQKTSEKLGTGDNYDIEGLGICVCEYAKDIDDPGKGTIASKPTFIQFAPTNAASSAIKFPPTNAASSAQVIIGTNSQGHKVIRFSPLPTGSGSSGSTPAAT